MFVLDTNVVSELMRDRPDTGVLTWLDSQDTGSLFITAVTEAEIRTGISILPDGQRRRMLNAAAERVFTAFFDDRVLAFDSVAAQFYALIATDRRAAGHPISQADCQIAAIARSCDIPVATRNVSDFEECGIEVFNPWAVRPV